MQAVKDQARQQIRAASPEPLQIPLKRKDTDEGLGQISKASSRKFGTNHICEQRSLKMKGCRWMLRQKFWDQFMKNITYVSSEWSGEAAHLRSLAMHICAISPELLLIALKEGM